VVTQIFLITQVQVLLMQVGPSGPAHTLRIPLNYGRELPSPTVNMGNIQFLIKPPEIIKRQFSISMQSLTAWFTILIRNLSKTEQCGLRSTPTPTTRQLGLLQA
jgi:hypothetical protein